MATINLTTTLFENLTDQEAEELRTWVDAVVLTGFRGETPTLIKEWFKVMRVEESLMAIATVVPQMVLMSLMKRKDAEFAELCGLVHMPVESGHKGVMGAVQSLVDALDLATGVPA